MPPVCSAKTSTTSWGKVWKSTAPDPRPFETPWRKVTQLATAQLERMQVTLTKLGIYRDKIDGKAGMKTRLALGAYQKANGLKVDCWPTRALLDHMQGKDGAN